jgi:hypothetical protein
MTTTPGCASVQRGVERHFRGTGGNEVELRAHLSRCPLCRAYYGRRLLVAQLDAFSLGPEHRLAVALGLAPPARRRLVHLWVPLAATALVLLLVLPRLLAPTEFRARGGAPEFARGGAPELWVYRFSSSGAVEPERGEIRRSDELAFAYRGSAEARFLLVFGRDEHGHIHWYHPEWTDASLDPASVPISADSARHELPAAISHALDGTELVLCGVFSRRALHVRDIERQLERAPVRGLESAEGTQVTCRPLRVSP